MSSEKKQLESTDTDMGSIGRSMSEGSTISRFADKVCSFFRSNSSSNSDAPNEPMDKVDRLGTLMIYSNVPSVEEAVEFNKRRGHAKLAAAGDYGDVCSERSQEHQRRFTDFCVEMETKYSSQLEEWPAQWEKLQSDIKNAGELLQKRA